MKAKEFMINVPINIKINGDSDPEIDLDDSDFEDTDDITMFPQQQELELQKASLGKKSIAAKQLLDDDPEFDNEYR